MTPQEKARVFRRRNYLFSQLHGVAKVEEALAELLQEYADARLEEAAKACRDYAHSGNVSMMRRQVAYACESRIRKLKGGV